MDVRKGTTLINDRKYEWEIAAGLLKFGIYILDSPPENRYIFQR